MSIRTTQQNSQLPEGLGLLVRNTLLLGVAITVTVLSIVILIPAEDNGYIAAQIDKERHLNSLANSPTPRIQLVGGSNVAFGFDSSAIEQATNYSVANMGLQSSLGSEYILHRLEQTMQSGDIVVISLEYYLFIDGYNGNKELLEMLQVYPSSIPANQLNNIILRNLDDLPRIAYEKLTTNIEHVLNTEVAPSSQVYRRSAFNTNGDAVAHLNLVPNNVSLQAPPLPGKDISDTSNETIETLNTLYKTAQDNAITLLVSFPCLPEEQYVQISDKLNDIEDYIRSNSDIPIINSTDSCILPANHFYDTIYHLNGTGITVRTDMLLNDIAPYLP